MANKNTSRRRSDPRPLLEVALDAQGPRPDRQVRASGRSVTLNLAESPLSWLHARGHIDARQYEAGEALRRDYERSQLGPRVTMRYEASPIQKGRRGPAEHLDPTEAHIAAKQRFDGALDCVGGGLKDICWRVICAGEAMAAAERGLDWPVRSGKLVLTLALDRLADFYRIPGR